MRVTSSLTEGSVTGSLQGAGTWRFYRVRQSGQARIWLAQQLMPTTLATPQRTPHSRTPIASHQLHRLAHEQSGASGGTGRAQACRAAAPGRQCALGSASPRAWGCLGAPLRLAAAPTCPARRLTELNCRVHAMGLGLVRDTLNLTPTLHLNLIPLTQGSHGPAGRLDTWPCGIAQGFMRVPLGGG